MSTKTLREGSVRPIRVVVLFTILITLPAVLVGSIYTPEVQDLTVSDEVYAVLREKGASELPVEALAYYMEGIESARAGDPERAIALLELAADIDPSFPQAHLALARYRLLSQPRAALEDFGQAVQASIRTFPAQHLILVNTVLGLIVLSTLGLLVLFTYAALQHLSLLHHSVREHFGLWFDGRLAALLAVIVMLIPALWRLGFIPLALAFLGVMWPWMRRGEQRWAGALIGVVVLGPVLLWGLSPLLYSPLDPAERSFLLGRAMVSAHSTNLVQELEASLLEHEDDPNLHFALGMVYKRGGYLDRAERHYRKALELGASPARVQNNLGVIAFLRGDYDVSLELLDESIRAEPKMAASHFNLSQTFAKKLFFEKADQELAKANGLAFNRIRDALRYTEGDARKTMIDEPLPRLALWRAAWEGNRFMPGLPEWLAFSFSGSLWLFPPMAIIVFVLAFILGRRLYQNLPTTGCTNCGRPVCRRCVRRVRREMYCGHCGDVLLRIQSSSYSKLVLDSQIRRNRRLSTMLSRFTVWVLPGLHAARTGRSSLSALLALGAMVGVLALVSRSLPVNRMAWIPDAPPGPWWPEMPIALLFLVFAISAGTVIKLRKSKRVKRAVGNDDASHEELGPEEAANAA